MRPTDRRVHSVSFCPFLCALGFVGLIRVRSVHSRTPRCSACLFWCVRSIPVRPGGRRIYSGGFDILPLHDGARRINSGAFGPFPYALGLVELIQVRSVRSRAPWLSTGSFWFVRCIPVRSWRRRVYLGSFVSFICVLGVVWFISMRPWCRQFRSGAFGALQWALGVVGCVLVPSGHFRAPWGWSGSSRFFRSIPVRPSGRRVHSGVFNIFRSVYSSASLGSYGVFLYVLGVAAFVRVRSVHSRVPLGSSGSFGFVRSISVRSGCPAMFGSSG